MKLKYNLIIASISFLLLPAIAYATDTTTLTLGTDTTPPVMGSSMSAVATSDTAIQLQWQAGTDNSGSVAYKLYRGDALLTTLSQTAFSDSHLTPNTSYYYRVYAIDAAGNLSQNFTTANAKTLATSSGTTNPNTTSTSTSGDTSAPSISEISVVTVNISSVRMYWKTNETATGTVQLQSDVPAAPAIQLCDGVTLQATTHCRVISNVASGHTYTYTITATDLAGNVTTSSQSNFIIPAQEKPAIPTGLKGQASAIDKTVTLMWTDASSNESSFKIGRRPVGGTWTTIAILDPNVAKYIDANVAPGQYEYDVSACNSTGCSDYSNIAQVTMLQTTSTGYTIVGKAYLPDGSAASGVYVDASPTTGSIVSGMTDSTGSFRLGVSIGDYKVTARPSDPSKVSWYFSGSQTVSFVAGAETTKTLTFTAVSITQKILVKAVTDDGSAVAGAGVLVIPGQCGTATITTTTNNPIQQTDSSGNAQFSLPASTYCIKGGVPDTRGLVNPEPQTIALNFGQTATVTLTFKKRTTTYTVTGKVTTPDGQPVPDAFVAAGSTVGGVETRTNSTGQYTLSLSAVGDWRLKGGKIINNIAYAAAEKTISIPTVTTQDIIISPVQNVPVQSSASGSATTTVTTSTQDGAQVTIPPLAATGSGTINLTIKPTVELPAVPSQSILGAKGYEVTVTDTTGQTISNLASQVEVLIPYDDATLTANNTTAEQLRPSYYNTATGQWVPVTTFTIDKTKHVFVALVNHFTLFALVAAADITPPAAPTAVSVTKSSAQNVVITWVDPKADFHHTKVYRSSSSNENGSVVAALVTSATYTDTTAVDSATYYYRLQAVDAAGNESILSDATVVTVGKTVPVTATGKHSVGTNVLSRNGTVYMITGDGQKRPYTSGGAFLSYGFNTFNGLPSASDEDFALPTGSFIPPQDGKIICSDRGTDKGTCYVITGQKKAGFTSKNVFAGLGFSFSRVSYGDVSWMQSATNVSNTTAAHVPGVLVNDNGTVYLVGATSRLGFPSKEIFSSWGYSFSDVVPANEADKGIAVSGVVATRNPGQLSPQ